MDTSSAKRPAESEQSVDTFAVCPNCSRLSENLGNCDKCGSPLSEDNAAVCYSSEPKRQRLDNSPSDSNTVNRNGTLTPTPASESSSSKDTNTTTTSTSTSSTSTTPVPQALYANKSATNNTNQNKDSPSPDQAPVRPHGLFVNVNNQAIPLPAPSTASIASASPAASPIDSRPAIVPGVTQASIPVSLTVNAAHTTIARPLVAPVGHITSATTTPLISPAVRTSVPARPGPPPLQQTNSRPPSYIQNAPAAQFNMQGAQRVPGPGPNPQGGGHAVTIQQDNILIPAQQIRIGSQKFKPLSPVTFKDDGILFTLRDYTYAPVLLNARAIIKCKANLNFKEYPVFFLHLESSCMRQIRNIFGLRDDEFGENFAGPYEIKRCITIFPNLSNCSYTPVQVQQAILSVFATMERRYLRYNKIIEEISPEDAIDMLLSPIAVRTGTVPTSRAPQSVPARAPPNRSLPQPPQMHRSPGMVNRAPPPSQPPVIPQTGNMPRPGGTLTIPNDPIRWEQMQRSLVVGGVYHVQMTNGHKKYCLWNGSQLVPCLVQNTEVQLDCSEVRIGSMRAQCTSSVRIKLDNNSGIYLTIAEKNLGTKNLHITLDDIMSAFHCFENMTRLFIYLKWSGAEKIRKELKMSRKDPTYDPNASEERRKHIVLSLRNVNQDQKEALSAMRSPGQPKTFFESLGILKALKILADIKRTSMIQTKLEKYMNGNEAAPSRNQLAQIANQLEAEFSRDDTPADDDDDDDDDVIMTQEEIGIKCPYTQAIMKDPVRNKVCGHSYEKQAIADFILRKKTNAKCPYAGCANRQPLLMSEMEDNSQLKDYILKNHQT